LFVHPQKLAFGVFQLADFRVHKTTNVLFESVHIKRTRKS